MGGQESIAAVLVSARRGQQAIDTTAARRTAGDTPRVGNAVAVVSTSEDPADIARAGGYAVVIDDVPRPIHTDAMRSLAWHYAVPPAA